MLKKAVKTIAFMLVISTSVFSFIYINSSSLNLSAENIGMEQPDLLPDEHTMVVPTISLVKKAIVVARGFLYPVD